MKNRTIMQTANSKQPIIARLKAWVKSCPFIYYPVRYVLNRALRPLASFINWQIHKPLVRFNRDGLNTTEHRDRRIIVSITSHPARINLVPYAIASILNQTMKPDKIILWLGIEKFPDKKLPEIFDKVKACGVNIEFRKDLGPHTKYFYAMREYPEDLIITFDDDWLYERDVIETLYKSYLMNPDCVSAMRFHKMTFLPDGSEDKHGNWHIAYKNALGTKSHSYFATGISGVLYPPKSVHEETFNIEAMQKLCPKADDVWLKIMEVMNDTKVASASNEGRKPAVRMPNLQPEALWRFNIAQGGNETQRKAVIDAYNTWPLAETGKTLLEMMCEDSDGVE